MYAQVEVVHARECVGHDAVGGEEDADVIARCRAVVEVENADDVDRGHVLRLRAALSLAPYYIYVLSSI